METRLVVEFGSTLIVTTKFIEYALEFKCIPLYDDQGAIIDSVLFVVCGGLDRVEAALERNITATYKAVDDTPNYRVEVN